MDHSARHSDLGRIIVVITSLLLVVSCWWTLQAFVPEPYFLRTPLQLKTMNTPNGFGQVERSLLPLYATAAVEVTGLVILAVFAWVLGRGSPPSAIFLPCLAWQRLLS